MNVKRLAFWCVIFGGLLAWVLLFERTDEQRPEAVMPQETYERVFNLEAADISDVFISDGEKTVRLAREGGDMRVMEPAGARAADDLIDSLLATIAGTVVIDEIAPGEDPAQYGLAPPAFTLRVQSGTGAEPVELLLGANAPSNVNLYARLPAQGRTVLLGTYLRFSLRTFLDNVK